MLVTTNEGNPNALKIIIAAKKVKKPVTIRTIDPNDVDIPVRRLPTLELPSGSIIFSVNASMQYVAPPSGDDDIEINRWLEWDVAQLQPTIVLYGSTGIYKSSENLCLWKQLNVLNSQLKSTEYLIVDKGDGLSLADIAVWVTLWNTVSNMEIWKKISEEFQCIAKWMANIEILPIIQESLKEFKIERGPKAIASIQAGSWFPLNSLANVAKPSNTQNKDSPVHKDKEPEGIREDEINRASSNWSTQAYPKVKEPPYPVLPKQGERNILITSALPYVNNVPHLGNIIGCVLSADIFARYCRQRNYNTLFISGTDEYGTATEAKALEENMTPQEICDKYFNIHNDVYRWLGIGFDYFGRTTTPEQTEIVQSFFLRIKSQGYILTETVDQLLCEACDRFLADRFVEGTCPGCKYEDARGDQCDGCGHLVNATDLISPRCKMCNNTPVMKKSQQFFLDLPKIEERLKEWSATVEKEWSPVARAVAKPWLRDGLKPRCITRDLKWGIPVPIEEFKKKVFYVWFDAPFGYISITKRYTKEYEQWWKPKDANISLYQFMAKDNVPFHAIMFPACLLAANQKHTLLKHLMATEYLNYEDTKFSKSRGIGVFGTDAQETGIPADVWRFYLAYIRPETQDSNFNWVDLATKNNSELLNNLGNFVNRALVFTENFFDSKIPPMEPQHDDLTVLAWCQRELSAYVNALEQAKIRDALKHVLAISKHGNQYMQSQQPWVKIKGTDDDKKKAGTVIGICDNLACLLSALLGPYMPTTARELRAQLGLQKNSYGYIPDVVTNILPAGHKIGKPSPLFTKIEEKQVEMLRKKYAGKQDNGNGKTSKSPATKGTEDVAALEAAIAKQGQLVRELKATKDKSVWQPEVQTLLELKSRLASLKTGADKPSVASPVKSNKTKAVRPPEQNGDVSAEVKCLELDISKQGQLVRELKATQEKSVWQPQVDILLSLKKKLADLTGTTPASDKKSKKSK